eukprot:3933624-Rhodomonas_salina.1
MIDAVGEPVADWLTQVGASKSENDLDTVECKKCAVRVFECATRQIVRARFQKIIPGCPGRAEKCPEQRQEQPNVPSRALKSRTPGRPTIRQIERRLAVSDMEDTVPADDVNEGEQRLMQALGLTLNLKHWLVWTRPRDSSASFTPNTVDEKQDTAAPTKVASVGFHVDLYNATSKPVHLQDLGRLESPHRTLVVGESGQSRTPMPELF